MLVIQAKISASRHHQGLRWQGILTVILTGTVLVISFGPLTLIAIIPTEYTSTAAIRTAVFLTNLHVPANFFIYALTVQSFREFLKLRISVLSSQLCRKLKLDNGSAEGNDDRKD